MGVNVDLTGAPLAPVVKTGTDGVITAKTYNDLAYTALRVDFTVRPGSATIRYVTVTRTVGGVDVGVVRGLDHRWAPRGAVQGIDAEPALRVPITYTAVATTTAGAVITSAPVVCTVANAQAWLRSLGTPRLSQPLNVAAYPDWSADVEQYATYPIASKFPTVSVGARRAGAGTLALTTRTHEDRDALEALTDPAQPVYLLQGSQQSGERDRYVSVGAVGYARPFQFTALLKRAITLPLVEVDRPDTAGWSVSIPGGTFDEAPHVPVSTLTGRSVDYRF